MAKKEKRRKRTKTVFLLILLTAVIITAATVICNREDGISEPFGSTNESVTETTEEITVVSTTQEIALTRAINEETGRIIIDPEQELWNLVVVNTSREMPTDYEPELAEILSTGYYMDERVVPFYEDMYNAAKEEGIILTPYSGYRSYARQERNYKNLTETYMSQYSLSREEAAKKAATVILPPGTSEHNLGLAMDICNTLDAFAETDEYKWLTENAHKYGFILRYTEEKMDITGIVDEPWHWRFVGVEYAEDIRNSGLCLEEYLDMKGIAY